MLGVPHVMFPFLAKVNTANYPINGIITHIWMNLLDKGMEISRCERAMPLQQIDDRVTK